MHSTPSKLLSAKVGALIVTAFPLALIFTDVVLDVDQLSRTHTLYLIPKGLDGP